MRPVRTPGWQRVLNELRRAGTFGVDQTQFLAPNVCDGGDPLTNLAGRIWDLRHKHGCVITEGGWRNGGCRIYVLVSEPAAVAPSPDPVPPAGLFDQSVGVAPPRSPYDEREAA